MNNNRLFPKPGSSLLGNWITRGFATVFTLLIVAFLVVVIVGAAMLIRVETFTSSNAQKIAEARQNALYGLECAVTDLQELAGPDQRVTATADLNRNSTSTQWLPELLPGGAANSARHWTGVWDVSKKHYIPDSTTPGRVISNVGNGANQLSPEPLRWLVSGGRRKDFGTESQTNHVTPLNYPGRLDKDGDITGVAKTDEHVVLLGPGTVRTADSADQPTGDGIVVPKVNLYNPASRFPDNPVGAYAFWIGDEGVKAKFQAGAEFKSFEDTYTGENRDQYRLLAPQKMGIGVISSTDNSPLSSIGFSPTDATFLPALRRLNSDTQIAYLPGGDTLGPAFRDRFHDITLHSKGVLVDVKKGGLKQDLTVYLQQGNLTGFIKDADLLYEDQRDNATLDATEPRSTFRARFPGFHSTSDNNLPRTGLLRSWYNLTSATIREQTSIQQGMFPVITRCEWPAWLYMNLNLTGATYPYTLPLNAFELRIFPTITLYNPCNADLPGQDYTVTMRIGSNASFELRLDTNTSGQPLKFNLSAALGGEYMTFRIPSAESALRAGESKVFTLRDSNVPYTPAMELVSDYATETPGFGSGITYPNNPNGHNPNSYFKITPSYADPASPLKINSGSGILAFQYLLYRPSSPPNTALARTTELSCGGNILQTITDAPANNGWVSFGSAGAVRMVFSGFSYNGALTREIDTRLPVASFHCRPLVHRASTAMDPVGGSLAPLVGFNYRAAKDAAPPAIWLGGYGESRYWGTKRNLIDGSNSITIRAYSPPITFGGSPAYERFSYTYQTAPSGPPLDVSAGFLTGDLGISAPLFGVRKNGLETLSLADFQHVNIAGLSWQPSYVVGNSFVDPKLKGRDCYAGFFHYGDAGAGIEYFTRTEIGNPANSTADSENRIYDASYTANDALWDRFFLSGAQTTATSQSADLLSNKKSLPNSRLRFRTVRGQDYNSLVTPTEKFERGSAFLMSDGSFNVNSTSVEAWKALLASRVGLKINSVTAGASEAVFSRLLEPGCGTGTFYDPPSGQPAAERAGAYVGARRLSAEEIQVLAEEIVKQVQQRGPFTSVSDFVNRRLTSEISGPPFIETEVSRTGFTGTLQAAIDAASDRFIVMGKDGINSAFYRSGTRGSYYTPEKIQVFPGGAIGQITDVNVNDSAIWGALVPRLAMLGRPWYYTAAGLPGFLTQADILQAIGPQLTARSDTFKVRAYGEAKNMRSGKTEARAWCEAIVQRIPDPLKENPTKDDIVWPERPQSPANPVSAAGRRFRIVAFRWLTPDEV